MNCTNGRGGVSNGPGAAAARLNYTAGMEPSPSPAAPRITVFLPCHTLDDFPAWLDEAEADDVLAAWTSGWHPALVAASGRPPRWSSVDLPPPDDGPLLGIVPAAFDARFAAQFDALAAAGSCWVRGIRGARPIEAAACAELGEPAERPRGQSWAEDFAALGLAVLLTELLARRMRSAADLDSTGFAAAVVTAARAAVAGDEAGCREALRECFTWLEGVRDRFYPVEAWLLDLVLVADSTLAAVAAELASPVPAGIVAPARLLPQLAAAHPAAVAAVRRRVAEGSLSCCGGRLDDGPLDGLAPEEILASFTAGRRAWLDHVGHAPTVFAERGGCSSALLPQLLDGLGYSGAVWGRFDGGPLPDPRSGRIRWEGAGGACVEAVARPPLDARTATGLLALPERLGDAMDHDHVAAVSFAHHAGTASHWHGLLRRAGSWTTALGAFVTPDELFRRTAGAGTFVAFGPEAFQRPPAGDGEMADPLGGSVATTLVSALRLEAAAGAATRLLAPAERSAVAVPAASAPRHRIRWWSRRPPAEALVLDDGRIRVQVHPETGGILSLRRPVDRSNRISQRLAWRGDDRAGTMRADAIERGPTASGVEGLVSRGRLLDDSGAEVGRFVQGVSLAAGLPAVILDVEISLAAPPRGRPFENHVACRFAWHENEDVEIRRSIHLQSVATARERFTAPHFIEVADAGSSRGPRPDPLAILPGGLPWHWLSSPHVLDTLLVAGDVRAATRRLAVGIGIERPWDAALGLTAGMARPPTVALPPTVRLEIPDAPREPGGGLRAIVGIVESAGRAGEVRIEWAADVAAAQACDFEGRPRDGVDVAIDGRATVVFLRPYEWLRLALEFRR
jgi:hypothetical protein